MGTIIKNTTSAFVDGQQITSAALNNLIDDAILNTTAVSAGTGLTVNASTGVLSMDTSLTGKTLTGGSLNNCPIGASTPSTGAFTTLSASGGYTGSVTGNITGNLTGNVTGGTGSFTTLTASDDANFDSGTLFVDASANRVGIGTVSPSNTLHVENTTSSGAYINYDGQSNTEFGLRIESNAAGGYFESDFGTGGTALLDLYANSSTVSGGDILVARTQSATPVMLVKGNGNVGIGTTSPSYKLDVNSGSTNQVALFESTDTTAYIELADNTGSVQLITPGNGALRIATGGAGAGSVGTSGLFIDQSQNVGIGDDTPSYKLDVNGTGRFASTVQFDGQTQNFNGAYDIYRSGAGYLRHRIADQTLSLGVTNTAGTVHYPIVMAAADDDLIFNNEEGEMARFDTLGRLGIGTVSPVSKLDVKQSADTFESGLSITRLGASRGTIYLDSSSNTLNISRGSTDSISIDSSGNVGIGTTTPSYKLDINDDAAIGAGLRVTGGGGGGPLATFTRDVSSTGTVEIGAASGDPQIKFTSASDNWSIGLDSTVFNICDGSAVGANQRLIIDTAGNVGIGTTSPNSALEVSGSGAEIIINDTTTSRPQLNFYNSGSSHGRIYASGFELRFETSGNGMRLDALGNVGIGTTGSPNSILEISSTTSGVIMPRMNTTEMNAISSPTNGEMIYNTSVNKFYGYANGSWVALH